MSRYRLPGPRLHMENYRPVVRTIEIVVSVAFGAGIAIPCLLVGFGWLL